jgi:hypothetical protein
VSSRSLSRLVLSGAVAAAALTACDGSSRVLAVRLTDGVADTTFSLGVGQEATHGVMRIVFDGVNEDSRCPSDVMCVWAGNAAVEIGVSFGMGPTTRYVLNTIGDPAFVDVGGYRITLIDLQPYPVSTSRIPPASYLATFRFQQVVYPPD